LGDKICENLVYVWSHVVINYFYLLLRTGGISGKQMLMRTIYEIAGW